MILIVSVENCGRHPVIVAKAQEAQTHVVIP